MRAILPVVAAVLLAGCGLKDDLYLPEPEPEVSVDEPAQKESENENEKEDDAANA